MEEKMTALSMSLTGSEPGFFEDAIGGSALALDNTGLLTGQAYAEISQAAVLEAATELAATTATTTTKGKAKKPVQRRQTQSKAKSKAAEGSAEKGAEPASKPEPKKRTRKAPKKAAAPPVDESQDEEGSREQTAELDASSSLKPVRTKVLERNRVAATKCRSRKRSEASTLAQCEQEMEDRNRQLSATFEELRHEIYVLKTQLLQHNNCNCVLIQKYIANEAKKSVDKLVGEGGPRTGTAVPVERGSISTPDWPGSSRGSTIAESIHIQSPMTNFPAEGAHTPWSGGYPANKAMPAHMMEGYQHGPPMIPYNTHITENSPMAYGPQRIVDMNEGQYPQQGFVNNNQHMTNHDHNMMWDSGWQVG
jgi:hypothetical protein